jgi:hypothetical protein
MLVHLFKDPRLIVAPVPFEVHILEHAVRDNEVDPDRLLLCPLCPQVCAKADRQQAFRVSDAARRRKVDGARTRGPHAVRYGDFDFALIPTAADGADKRKGPIAAGPILR